MTTEQLEMLVDGQRYERPVEPWRTLADVLRDDLDKRGVRVSCDQGVCGSCTVLVDGEMMASCSLLAYRASGCDIQTIHGLTPDGDSLHLVQEAFMERFGFQCGYCTSGMIMATCALLAEDPHPDHDRIKQWLNGNICRCTGYETIVEAVDAAAAKFAQEGQA
jgi:aerobic carbon-monoxide dehydrogenase small subunit